MIKHRAWGRAHSVQKTDFEESLRPGSVGFAYFRLPHSSIDPASQPHNFLNFIPCRPPNQDLARFIIPQTTRACNYIKVPQSTNLPFLNSHRLWAPQFKFLTKTDRHANSLTILGFIPRVKLHCKSFFFDQTGRLGDY